MTAQTPADPSPDGASGGGAGQGRGTVLVTGASGFIAKHVILALLSRGYQVRGTVRDPAKADVTLAALQRAGGVTTALSFVAADLLSDDGWDAAVAGCDSVMHTASPFPVQQPDDGDDLIRPARDGTLRVLHAATRAGCRRVVLTSSTVAMLYGSALPRDHVYTEADFTDEMRSDITPYIRSKTVAEKAAWAFVRDTTGAPELAVINPGFVHGPALDDDLSTSHEVFRLMSKGIYPAAPKIRFPVADVSDVALAHLAALERPEANGQRYLIADGLLGLYDLGVIMANECPDLASKAPKFELPDMVVRGLAIADKRLRTILPELGKHKVYSNAKVRDGLGIALTEPETAVIRSVRSLRQLGVI